MGPHTLSPRLITPAVALSLLVVMAVGCSGSGRPVVRVGDQQVGPEEWKAYLRSHGTPGKTPDVKAALADLTRREVAWQLATREGLLSTKEWAETTAKNRREVLASAYLANLPGPPPLTDAQARDFYIAHNQERHVLHILKKSREEADIVRARLKGGEPFAKVAKELSEDPSAKDNGGDLGWIRSEQMVKEFSDAVFQAPQDEIVGPFKTQYGWHVALVKETRGPTVEEFEKDRAEILKKIARMQEDARRQTALAPLKKTYPLQPDGEVLDLDRTLDVTPEDAGRIAGRVAGATISLKEVKLFIADALSTSGQSHSLGPEMKARFMDTLADDYRLARAAQDSGLDKRPEVKADLWDRDRESALLTFSESYLNKLQPDEATLRQHYAANPSRFLDFGSARLYLIVAESRERAEQALLDASGGAPWKALFDRYANREATGNWDMGWVELSTLRPFVPPDTMKAMLSKPLGHVVGPVGLPDGFALFKVIERRPGPPMPFETCKELVRLDYLRDAGTGLVRVYLDGEGRKGMKVETFPERAALPAGK